MSTDDSPRQRSRRRRVAFGNPSLSVFGGYVETLSPSPSYDEYTGSDDSDSDGDGENDSSTSQNKGLVVRSETQDNVETMEMGGSVVAMLDVPPEQVPDGILNFVRAHRPNIEHVRIVITDDDDENDVEEQEEHDGHRGGSRRRSVSLCHGRTDAAGHPASAPVSGDINMPYQQSSLFQQTNDTTAGVQKSAANDDATYTSIPFGRLRSQSFSPASTTAAAAAALAANNGSEDTADSRLLALKRLEAYADGDIGSDEYLEGEEGGDDEESSMTYLVLFQLSSNETAEEFVADLDGRPYTSLQEDVTCTLCRVVSLKGDGGVSLMSPFFAPSSMGSVGGGMSTAAGTGTSLLADFSSPIKSNNVQRTMRRSLDASTAAAADAVRATMLSAQDKTPSPPPPISDAGAAAAAARRRGRSPITASAFGAGGAGTHTPSEAHNCAVCLERLEMAPGKASGTTGAEHHAAAPIPTTSLHNNTQGYGIITTVCNHTFHIDCLLRWQDSPCPVCRFDHSGLDEALSSCHVCGTTEHNYVCLICGVVSCGGGTAEAESIGGAAHGLGRDNAAGGAASACAASDIRNVESRQHGSDGNHDAEASIRRPLPPVAAGHARQHYDETLHAYALDTETQHVWDFAGQGYVHRLIQNKEDGKLVEVNDPSNTSSAERTLSPGLSDAQEDEMLHRKLEGFASQYYMVLKSQLEQQRIFYEAQLDEIRREHDGSFGSREGRRYGQDLISALKREKNQVEQRCLTLRRKLKKVLDDISFLQNMNESLEGNKEPMRRQIMEVQRQRAETRDMLMKCLPPLEAKLAMLFTQLEGGSAMAGEEQAEKKGDSDGDKKPAARK